jgi:sRNA-binding protein
MTRKKLPGSWPRLFGKQPLPLAVWIGQEIAARAAKARLKQFKIGAALYTWTNSRRYLAAVAAEGAVRWNLAGTAVDFVAREH